jgi:glucose/arabinose dehydrogenase
MSFATVAAPVLLIGAALILAATPAAAVITDAPAVKSGPVNVTTFAKGLVHPWGLAFLPDGRLLVTERPGRMRLIGKDGQVSPPLAGVPKVHAEKQGGLLDVRLAPDFAKSGTIFFSYAEPRGGGENGTAVARAKLVLEGDGGRLDNVEVIFRQQPSYASDLHFGSRLVFDRDGMLFVTLGERFELSKEAQNPANHIGKIVRITPDGAPAPGNPNLPGWDPKVWSIGHRNIQGADLHPETGELWEAEHGPRGGDELNIARPGRNFGWPVIGYGRHYSGAKIGVGTAKEGLEQPIYYWDPSIAVSGLAFYTADLFPGWKGNLFTGALAGEHLDLGEVVYRFGFRHFFTDIYIVLLSQFGHFYLQLTQVVFRNGAVAQVHIVIKAVVERRSYPKLYTRVHGLYGLSHQVG